ncbi:MAG: porin [Allosphingosinicella sp.]|uniref:porin n=1 Tax=Allosphingosinicella sp. TaxID=2823234 RepID=UPI00395C94F1
MGLAGGVSLLAISLAVPAIGEAQRNQNRAAPAPERVIGTFTPAVRDPRLAAMLASRRVSSADTAFRFTPAATPDERSRAVRVAVRVRPGVNAPERLRTTTLAAAATGTQITPSSYNLGVSVGWRRFAITGDVARSNDSAALGSRESTRIGAEYQANRRLTGRVQVGAERAEGVERIVGDDRAYSLDVGGSYSIARNLDVTGGLRYRVSRDRLEPLARDERRDSQAVYIGTAIRF